MVIKPQAKESIGNKGGTRIVLRLILSLDFVEIHKKKDDTLNEARLKAYESLLKYEIDDLPVNYHEFSDNIKFFSMQFLSYMMDRDPEIFLRSWKHRGIVLYEPRYDNYVIFFNAADPAETIRWSLATAIGCIELGYHRMIAKDGITLDKQMMILEEFCYSFNCPDVILKESNIFSAQDIMRVCAIPFHKAREKMKRLKLTITEPGEYEENLCTHLLKLFRDFIHREKPELEAETSKIDSEKIVRYEINYVINKSKNLEGVEQ